MVEWLVSWCLSGRLLADWLVQSVEMLQQLFDGHDDCVYTCRFCRVCQCDDRERQRDRQSADTETGKKETEPNRRIVSDRETGSKRERERERERETDRQAGRQTQLTRETKTDEARFRENDAGVGGGFGERGRDIDRE